MQNIVVVDDHKVFAELLAMALSHEPDLDCVGHAQSVDEGMALVESVKPDIVIMDVQLGDGDGIAATAELTERFPDLRVVVLTAHVDQRLLQRAAAANACALLPKDGDLPDMLNALRSSRRGGFAVHPQLLRRLVGRSEVPTPRRPPLTQREQEVLQLMAEGKTNSAIAATLHISTGSAEKHIASIFTKLGLAPDETENRRVLAVLRYLES